MADGVRGSLRRRLSGIADKYFAISWQSLELSPGEEHFVLDVGKERLKKAPGFDKSHWPDVRNGDWALKIPDARHQVSEDLGRASVLRKAVLATMVEPQVAIPILPLPLQITGALVA